MTKIIARIPASVEFELPSKAETHAGRIAEIHGLLKSGLIGASLEAETPAGKTTIVIRGLEHEPLHASWDNDPDNAGVTSWNSFGQQLDTREFDVVTNSGDDTLLDLRLSPDGDTWKTVAVVAHPAVAEAIGKAWQDGYLTFHPRHNFL